MSNRAPPPDDVQTRPRLRSGATLLGHLQIARLDHWPKNVFVLPGIVAAVALDTRADTTGLWWRIVVGLLSIGLVASSNYTLNEVLDASFDRHHPSKQHRPVPSGLVHIPLAMLQWVALGLIGLALGRLVSTPFTWTMLALWIMGGIYNIPPIRSKDIRYLDVLSEAVNNPLRLLAGWFMVTDMSAPPATLMGSYYMIGCYFMAIKRLGEIRQLGNVPTIAAYRKSLAHFTQERLLIVIMFYGATAMLFFGAFVMRYRLELILAFPLVALVMAEYLSLAFREDSAAQHPERLYREPRLMLALVACTVAMTALLFVHLPWLHRWLHPTIGEERIHVSAVGGPRMGSHYPPAAIDRLIASQPRDIPSAVHNALRREEGA